MFILNQSATILKTLTGEVRNINHLIIKQCSGNTESRQICRVFDMHSFTHLQTTWSSIPMVFPHWQHPSLSGQCAPPDCSRMGWRTQKRAQSYDLASKHLTSKSSWASWWCVTTNPMHRGPTQVPLGPKVTRHHRVCTCLVSRLQQIRVIFAACPHIMRQVISTMWLISL